MSLDHEQPTHYICTDGPTAASRCLPAGQEWCALILCSTRRFVCSSSSVIDLSVSSLNDFIFNAYTNFIILWLQTFLFGAGVTFLEAKENITEAVDDNDDNIDDLQKSKYEDRKHGSDLATITPAQQYPKVPNLFSN